MKNIFFFLFITSVFACKTSADLPKSDVAPTSTVNAVEKYDQLEANKNKEVLIYGKIVQKEFVNKGGRATGVMETLLELKDGETVNIRNKGENKYDYKDFIGKNVEMKAIVFYGNIDSDNPEHQSRVGFRIDYTVITPTD